MTRLFADSSYWIALLSPADELHFRATRLARKFSSAEVVTSEMVLAEVLNGFSHRGPHLRKAAGSAVQGLYRMRNVIVMPHTPDAFQKATRLYLRVGDKSWSLTDCASFEIMQAERISAALTHDRHFVQAGFEALMS